MVGILTPLPPQEVKRKNHEMRKAGLTRGQPFLMCAMYTDRVKVPNEPT
jgi:hypothetical protein